MRSLHCTAGDEVEWNLTECFLLHSQYTLKVKSLSVWCVCGLLGAQCWLYGLTAVSGGAHRCFDIVPKGVGVIFHHGWQLSHHPFLSRLTSTRSISLSRLFLSAVRMVLPHQTTPLKKKCVVEGLQGWNLLSCLIYNVAVASPKCWAKNLLPRWQHFQIGFSKSKVIRELTYITLHLHNY